jgi:ferredoxin
MWALLLNRWTLSCVAVAAMLGATFYMGNTYGPNARAYAKCKAETVRRNDAIERVNRDETERHEREEADRDKASRAFANCPNVQACILTRGTAQCLNLLQ